MRAVPWNINPNVGYSSWSHCGKSVAWLPQCQWSNPENMNKYTIWIHYITTKKKNNNKTKFWLYYTYHVITTYKLKGMDRKRHMDSFQVNYIATTKQSTTKPWEIMCHTAQCIITHRSSVKFHRWKLISFLCWWLWYVETDRLCRIFCRCPKYIF